MMSYALFCIAFAVLAITVQAMPIREDLNTTLSISRSTVHSRMQQWVDEKVPYSQQAYHDGYRTDCSGKKNIHIYVFIEMTALIIFPSITFFLL